jgi:hypothetical protein
MTYDMHATRLLEIGVPRDPQTIQLVGLCAHCLYHLLTVMRHEQGYIQEYLVLLSLDREAEMERLTEFVNSRTYGIDLLIVMSAMVN